MVPTFTLLFFLVFSLVCALLFLLFPLWCIGDQTLTCWHPSKLHHKKKLPACRHSNNQSNTQKRAQRFKISRRGEVKRQNCRRTKSSASCTIMPPKGKRKIITSNTTFSKSTMRPLPLWVSITSMLRKGAQSLVITLDVRRVIAWCRTPTRKSLWRKRRVQLVKMRWWLSIRIL